MEQPNEQPIEPIQSSKNIWIIVIAVIITALVVGGGVYAWQRSNLKNTEQGLQQQISVLQNQVSQLQQTQANQNQQTTQPVVKQEQNTQPEEPTSQLLDNWKIYTNTQEKYSVKYPSSLIVDDNNSNQVTIASLAVPYITVTTYQSSGNTDLQSFVQKKLIEEFNGLLTANEIKWVTIDNDYTKIGVKFPSKAGGYDGELYWVYIGHNYKVYKVAVLTDYGDMTQSEFQNKIISGFEFID